MATTLRRDVASLRVDYRLSALRERDMARDPFAQFARWFKEASRTRGVIEPNAMTLATASRGGRPSARVVLLKSWDRNGFVFFTNYNSRKARELAANPGAALSFMWLGLQRQVQIEGKVRKVPAKLADLYFATRPRESQIGAWASPQSSVVASRSILEERFRRYEKYYADVAHIPRPPNWGGYCVVPTTIEFWQGRQSRLHDRLVYRRRGNRWVLQRLAP